MSKLVETVIKSQKIYNMLSPKIQNETIRAITTNSIEELLPPEKKFSGTHSGRLYAISESKRQKIFKSILESDSLEDALHLYKKHIRHMDTVVFKVMFDIMKQHLRTNSEVISMYPEYFI